eukprot:TRINITY_DN42717_c0_g1_i5.p1 TRINITY_DN42717_c0_g1~~TRINITY_DN42717_c0_g1_i5.p1  ORF type:complete len:116 (-),score=31.74 TRINITY_DN42717_c0_g1_i5:12-359(-)
MPGLSLSPSLQSSSHHLGIDPALDGVYTVQEENGRVGWKRKGIEGEDKEWQRMREGERERERERERELETDVYTDRQTEKYPTSYSIHYCFENSIHQDVRERASINTTNITSIRL